MNELYILAGILLYALFVKGMCNLVKVNKIDD